MVVKIQAAEQMYKQRLEVRIGKWEWTDYTDKTEQTEYVTKKTDKNNAKIRKLYVRMKMYIFGTSLSHNFL